MLMSCDLAIPKVVFSHGFVNDANGDKMSKSIGNIVDPMVELQLYKPDVLRFFLTYQAQYGDDLNFGRRALDAVNDGLLV